MKKQLLTILVIINTKLICAQLSQQWINNFCCFDSIAPHTFSYPLGNDLNADTLTLAFFEDYYINFKKINTINGNDIQHVTFQSDTIQSPFHFGGGTTKIANHYITSSLKYDIPTGQCRLFHLSVNNNLTADWSNEIQTTLGKISAPLSNSLSTDFFTCAVSDSIRLFKQTVNGIHQWVSVFPLLNSGNNYQPLLFLDSQNDVTILVREQDTTLSDYSIRLIKVNSINGIMIMDSVFSNTLGNSHLAKQVHDTLHLAFIKMSGNIITYSDINLLSYGETKYFPSSVSSFSNLTKFAIDTLTNNYYLKTLDNLIAYTQQDSLLFNLSLPTEMQGQYDEGNFSFDQQNIFTAYSIYNSLNTPPNNDIKVLMINKTNGVIISNTDFNDTRNTDDNYIDQIFSNGDFYILFANNFDNGSILQEETQIGVIKYIDQPLNILSSPNNHSQINIFPNPFNKQITVKFANTIQLAEYSIYTNQGRMLMQDLILNGGILDLSKLNSGTYTMKLKFNDGTISFIKIVKI